MKNIAIVNHFGKQKIDYKKVLENMDVNVKFFTNKGYYEQFKDDFSNIYVYEDKKEDENLYIDLIKMHQEEKFDVIIANSEFDIEKIANIRDYLKVNGQGYKSGLAFRNKLLMKELVKDSVRTPRFSKLDNVLDLMNFIDKVGYPIVIKPQEEAGSKGVSIIFNEKDLELYLKNGVSKGSIIEEFIEGEMYHVDGMYQKNSILFSIPAQYINGCLAYREGNYNASIILEDVNPLKKLLNEETEKVLNALPKPNHAFPFHAEFFVKKNGEVVFCEIGCRVGGGMILETTKYITGINMLEESLKIEISEDYEISDVEINKICGFVSIPARNGILKDLRVCDQPWVEDYLFKKEFIGKKYKNATEIVDFVIIYLVSGETEVEVLSKIEYINNWQNENMIWIEDEVLIGRD